jgi:hypothetical protein
MTQRRGPPGRNTQLHHSFLLSYKVCSELIQLLCLFESRPLSRYAFGLCSGTCFDVLLQIIKSKTFLTFLQTIFDFPTMGQNI